MRHPAVLEAAAVAIPSDLGEDDILVVVTLQPGRGLGLCRAAGLLLRPDAVFLCAAVSGSARRDTEKRDRAGSQGPASQERSRRGRMGPRGTRLHPQSLDGREKHMTMSYQQEFVLAGVAGRAAILNLTARHNRLFSAGDFGGWIATFRHAGATFVRGGRRSPTCAMPSTAATDSGWSPSTTTSRSTASMPPRPASPLLFVGRRTPRHRHLPRPAHLRAGRVVLHVARTRMGCRAKQRRAAGIRP